MHTQKLTINLSNDLVQEIEHYKKVADEPSRAQAIIDLLKHALTLPPYFKGYDWKKAEAAADKDIAKGRVKSFKSVKELLADLKK
ncbi:MAG TPA: hypothetical protein DHU69_04890 [Deltaproteobacteria bacterium]|nr:MAG: hypothetical protein A3D29_00490 [Deltaproteobacteria bacterium RIFCSPHIGHO2_02_FULL_42_44]OGQ75923.1 MAG: hypothetical protein A2235_04510 [Deltaproteobacteria bacterium RIFOXYA2_FULL_42_10]HAG50573.1 hypothetical protein [Deltaproteobacteria bacterium]HCY19093.1 hypothetical protein [Deltaproteobacteria bacterium]